jgi:hypothetical protein
MTNAGVFGLWAGPGVVTASVAGLLWLHGATGPGWHVRTWPADGSAPDGELEDRSRGGLTLESASDAPDR